MFTLKFAGKTHKVETLQEASEIYCAARDKSGKGASQWRDGKIFDDGKQIARVSYNGRVWAGMEYDRDATPLYCNGTGLKR